MNCRDALKWISMDMDGELPERRRARLAEHLAGCATCRAARESWAVAGERFRAREIPGMPTAEAAWADVRRALRQQGAREAPAPWGTRLAWAAATAAVIGVVSFMAVWRGREPVAPEVAAKPATEVEWVETGLPGATPMVYEDAESGWVVIWIVEANGKEKGHAGS